MNGLFDQGRPKRIRLAVLIERVIANCHRGEFCGSSRATSSREIIEVR